jgi:WD40 repeat protein
VGPDHWPARAALAGHSQIIRSLAFSPDGKLLASSTGNWTSADVPGEVKLWDMTADRLAADLPGHEGMVYTVRFAPDGKTLATTCKDKRIRLWDVAAREVRTTLEGHTAAARALTFSADGARVATGSWDNTVRLWDAQTGKALGVLKARMQVNCVAFAPDGKTLAASQGTQEGKGPGIIRLFDVDGLKERLELKGHKGRVLRVVFAPDGKTLISAGGVINAGGEICLWDADSAQLRATLHGHRSWIEGMAQSGDGKRLATASPTGVLLWDAGAAPLQHKLQGHSQPVISAAFSADGSLLATGSWDKTIQFWDPSSGAHAGTLQGHRHGVRNLVFTPDAKTLISCSEDKTIRLWDVANRREVKSFPQEKLVYSIVLSPDGKTLAAGFGEDWKARKPGELKLLDPTTGRELAALADISREVRSLAFSPDGRMLAAALGDGNVKVWEVVSRKLLAAFTTSHTRVVAFSPDGKLLAATLAFRVEKNQVKEAGVRFWDTASWQERTALRGHTNYVFGLALSADGRLAATACQDGTVKLWPAPRLRDNLTAGR